MFEIRDIQVSFSQHVDNPKVSALILFCPRSEKSCEKDERDEKVLLSDSLSDSRFRQKS